MTTMTDKQAYAAMFNFLQRVYDQTSSDDIGGLLGSMSLLDDDGPADPGIAEDWDRAVRDAIGGRGPGGLELS